jgi:hypothetical protein
MSPELWRAAIFYGQNYNGAPIAGPDTRPDLAGISTGVDFIARVLRAAEIEIGHLNAPTSVMK